MRPSGQVKRILEWKYFLPACLVIGFVLRVAWARIAGTVPVLDWAWYYGRAVSLADGNGYVANGNPTAYWPIGWPAVLSLGFLIVEPSVFVGQLINIFIYLGIIVVSYYLVLELFRSRPAGALAALMLAVYPNHIAYSSVLCCETLYTFLTLLGVLLLAKAKHRIGLVIAAGLVLGYAILTREQGFLVPLIAAVVFARRDLRAGLRGPWLRTGILVNVVALLVVMPWTVRNYLELGHLIPVSTNTGANLWIGNNPRQDGTKLAIGGVFDEIGRRERPKSEYEWNQASAKYALRYIATHPLRTLRNMPIKLFVLYRGDTDGTSMGTPDSPQARLMKLACRVYYYPLMLVFLIAMISAALRRKVKGATALPTVGLWLIGYWAVGNMIVFSSERFHYASMPWIIMYAAAFIAHKSFDKANYEPSSRVEDNGLMAATSNAQS